MLHFPDYSLIVNFSKELKLVVYADMGTTILWLGLQGLLNQTHSQILALPLTSGVIQDRQTSLGLFMG